MSTPGTEALLDLLRYPEREVAALIAQDLDTAGIAERLFISPWTVQDHCKAIFEKTGTHTRREFRALVFFNDHLPAIVVRTPLDSGGHLEELRHPANPPPGEHSSIPPTAI